MFGNKNKSKKDLNGQSGMPGVELEFNVMPKGKGESGAMVTPHAKESAPPKGMPVATPTSPSRPTPVTPPPRATPPSGGSPPKKPNEHMLPPERKPSKSWLIRIFVIVIVLAILAIAGYFAYNRFFTGDNSGNDGSTPDITVPEGNNDTQPSDVDSDNDGLSDEEEQAMGTDQLNPDTDKDGLADGDEVNVYGSDPLQFDTDGDGFEDGQEPAFDYSPIVNSHDKITEAIRTLWDQRIGEFGLHEPTPSTFILKQAATQEGASTVEYQNTMYGYSLMIPDILTTRENESGLVVGLYVEGTTPDSEDAKNDPLYVQVAAKASEQSLQEWIDGLYAESDYTSIEDIEGAEGLTGKRLNGLLSSTSCPSDGVFFADEATVAILILSCNQNPDFQNLFSDVVAGFKFIP